MIQRRDFLSMAAASGLGMLFPRGARAESSKKYDGPYWITVQAEGGWDPTCFCDPKGGIVGRKDSINQSYAPEQIGKVGAIPYAPISMEFPVPPGQLPAMYGAKEFFQRVGSRFLVVNGIDTSTNNHETGRRVIWSGRAAEGYPSIAALLAAAACEVTPAPMAFLSYGGYEATANAVPLTRGSNVDNLWRMAYPNRIEPRKPASATYFDPATEARLAEAETARAQRLLRASPMPVMQRALSSLLAVRQTESGLDALAQTLPEKLISDVVRERLNATGVKSHSMNELLTLLRQGQLALCAFKAGVGVSASLVIGGFDTHGDHDHQHIPRLVQLLAGVDLLIWGATELGLADKLYIAVGSDFGRTPWYNAGNGKDHWAVTSMLLSGPGIIGGRVVGGTDASFQPLKFDPKTLSPSSTGVRIQPAHLHHALRKLARVESSAVAGSFPLAGEALPFFA